MYHKSSDDRSTELTPKTPKKLVYAHIYLRGGQGHPSERGGQVLSCYPGRGFWQGRTWPPQKSLDEQQSFLFTKSTCFLFLFYSLIGKPIFCRFRSWDCGTSPGLVPLYSNIKSKLVNILPKFTSLRMNLSVWNKLPGWDAVPVYSHHTLPSDRLRQK